MKFLLISLILILSSHISKAVDQKDNFQASFRQERILENLKVRLASSGVVKVSAQDGILWKQMKPFEHTIKISKDEMTLKTANGPLEKVDNPMMKYIGNLMMKVVRGQVDSLKDVFSIDVDQSEKDVIKYVFIPKDKLIKKGISKIYLKKKKFVESVEVFEVSGNRLKIEFVNYKEFK